MDIGDIAQQGDNQQKPTSRSGRQRRSFAPEPEQSLTNKLESSPTSSSSLRPSVSSSFANLVGIRKSKESEQSRESLDRLDSSTQRNLQKSTTRRSTNNPSLPLDIGDDNNRRVVSD